MGTVDGFDGSGTGGPGLFTPPSRTARRGDRDGRSAAYAGPVTTELTVLSDVVCRGVPVGGAR
ncbi:hypothetical protein, partial [Micromonospora sp. D75]|uniref:hypothetical protein n=1 Tax=Micromonospora sp. D75 TaxID=2824885 RepID=UPI001B382C70